VTQRTAVHVAQGIFPLFCPGLVERLSSQC
jgi:hypothetical protein